MKQPIAIDATNGRIMGEPEPDFKKLATLAVDKKMVLTPSNIQRQFKLTYRDACLVLEYINN